MGARFLRDDVLPMIGSVVTSPFKFFEWALAITFELVFTP
jgi:hypothetical protein